MTEFFNPPEIGVDAQEEKETQKRRAVEQIHGILSEVGIMGFNDYEIPALQKLIAQVEAGEMSPEEALAQAHAIKNNKQDYH